MRTVIIASLVMLCLVACSRRDPVADGAGNAAAAEVDVLPPDESVATPTNQLQSGDDEPSNADDQSASGKIPTALRGRWGLTPGACMSRRRDSKGLLIVSGDTLKFHESLGRPAGELETSGTSARGDFTFSGEGSTWKKYEALELQDNKLVRTESDPITSYAYARCTS